MEAELKDMHENVCVPASNEDKQQGEHPYSYP